ncbi:MAG: ribonuclease H-like domain-containing protein [Flavobacteriaceae bacterium]
MERIQFIYQIINLWRFGDYKHYTSLKLMAHVLNIPSPKDDIDGSQVSKIYYEDQNLERIVEYCEKDTLTVAQLFLRLRNEPLIETHQIHFSP